MHLSVICGTVDNSFLGMQLNALHCINISKQHFISLKRIRICFKIKEGQNKLQIHRRIILLVTNWANTIVIFSFNFVFDKYVNHKPVSLVMLYSFSIIQYIVIDHLFVF